MQKQQQRMHDRVILGRTNSRTDQVDKWQQHAESLLEQFSVRLQEATKAKGLDRRRAVEKALEELNRFAALPENAHEAFLAQAWEIVDTVFPA
jgi:hypothetical protein